jgi:hypothetical protein
VYLASSREHPPAAAVRQQQRDLSLVVQFMRDFSERQSNLFLLVSTFLARYEPADLESIVDDDVTEAVAAMASTFETASRGVIYEHRPASLPAERLVSRLKPLIAEAGQRGGATFERDAAFVLRRMAEAAGDARTAEPGNRRAFLDLLGRVVRKTDSEPGADSEGAAPSRLIVP